MVAAKKDNVIVNIDEAENFVFRTKNADYTLDFKQLIVDYGVIYVTDSDGKRINKGDTVYGHSDGKAWHVTGVFNGDYPVWAIDDDGNSRELKAEWLTHNKPEPDSFEKIKEDAELSAKDYCIKWFGSFNNQPEKEKLSHIIMRCKNLYIDSVKQPNADFDWEAFKNREIAVHCKTNKLANDFLKAVKNHFYIKDYFVDSDTTYWNEYKDKTCYAYDDILFRVEYGSCSYCKENGYTIVEWEN